MNGNIVLVGMPGAGKSTIGVLLAKVLGCEFIDTDLVIQQKEKRLLQEIINDDGITNFLNIEKKAVLGIDYCNAVIATGGSVIYNESSIEHLRRGGGIVLYLYIEYQEMVNRIKNINTRGIVIAPDQTLKHVYDEREPLYRKYSDLIVDCNSLTYEEVLNAVIEKL